VLLGALLALWLVRRSFDWRIRLLLAWVAVVIVFFQLWPVKGFQYLLPAAPPIAILAALGIVLLAGGRARIGRATDRRTAPPPAEPRTVETAASASRAPRGRTVTHPARSFRPRSRRLAGPALAVALTLLTAGTLAAESWSRIQPSESAVFLAGSGGIAGGREAGLWIREHTPAGAQLMTVGPSMANVISFYGHRTVYGLSVSPNPLRRNPSYDPIPNPDLQIRSNELQYVVWDSYSAARSPFFAAKLMDYVDRYHGRQVHAYSVTPAGTGTPTPVIVVYEVRR
jgi:hypothetical protein